VAVEEHLGHLRERPGGGPFSLGGRVLTAGYGRQELPRLVARLGEREGRVRPE
jgi:hypothetical protein